MNISLDNPSQIHSTILIRIISNSSVRESLPYTRTINRVIKIINKGIKIIVSKPIKAVNNALRPIKTIKETLVSRYPLRQRGYRLPLLQTRQVRSRLNDNHSVQLIVISRIKADFNPVRSESIKLPLRKILRISISRKITMRAKRLTAVIPHTTLRRYLSRLQKTAITIRTSIYIKTTI